VPVYDPLRWNASSFVHVASQFVTGGSIYQSALWHTLVFVGASTALCLAIGYPVAYFLARHAGRSKKLFLVAFVAPFWISYMMRMLAWINLLQPEGDVNRLLADIGLIHQPVQWLNGKPLTVILGLTYGYIPYMILPLFGTLDRINRSELEAARDLGAGQVSTFLRVTLPLSRQAILAGIVIVTLPMFGDYFTTALLASTRNTSMIGTIIVSSIGSSLVQEGAALVLLLVLALIAPMLYYLRSTSRAAEIVVA
jgi:spermidine/putrescine transport system permease protein